MRNDLPGSEEGKGDMLQRGRKKEAEKEVRGHVSGGDGQAEFIAPNAKCHSTVIFLPRICSQPVFL